MFTFTMAFLTEHRVFIHVDCFVPATHSVAYDALRLTSPAGAAGSLYQHHSCSA